jgi:hypothetical protein
MFAGEIAAGLIGIHDQRSIRQFIPREVVIGNEYLHAETVGFRHPFYTGYAIIDSDQYVRAARPTGWGCAWGTGCKTHDLGCEAITVFEAVGDKIIDYRAELPQGAVSLDQSISS